MKLPLKVEYACRVLVRLEPTFATGKVRRIEDLARDEELSANYLVQILNDMRSAGIVDSRRGKHGGYLLARDPERVTLLEIVHAVEGPLLQLNSTGEGASGARVASVWQEIFEAFDALLASRSLADIARHGEAQMWHI